MERYYYTLQTVEAWNYFKENKVIQSTPQYEQFPDLYLLMKKEMEVRLPNYNSEEGIIWLSPYYTNIFDHNFSYTKPIVQLEIALNEEEVLDSYFYLWHCFVMKFIHEQKIPEYKEFVEVFDVENLKLESPRNIQCTIGKISIDKVVSCEYAPREKIRKFC